jgi:hypothetical protein
VAAERREGEISGAIPNLFRGFLNLSVRSPQLLQSALFGFNEGGLRNVV